MREWIDAATALVVLSNLRLLGTSRLLACVRIVAVQGILLALLPLLSHAGDLTLRVALQATASMITKGIVFPWLLTRAVRGADVRRELDPIVGYTPSLLIGGALLGVALWLGWRLPLPGSTGSQFLIAVSLYTIMVGLFMIVARRMAITQVLGYLVMENGIYTFGLAFAEKEPLLVEMGILLDVFVAVFVMGIMIYNINREFDHIDTDRLSELKG
ncbi:MAG: hydrogenase [Candidatus Latescibacterota bacterium]|nr:MAG: hydrogenase [Candidatus Latescibacterota bacterium]